MRVLVVGAESTGGRWLSALLRRFQETSWINSGGTDLEDAHYSMPHGPDDQGRGRHWPTEHDFDNFDPDAVLVMTRDWYAQIGSAAKNHQPFDDRLAVEHAETAAREAYRRIMAWLGGAQVRFSRPPAPSRWRFVSHHALSCGDDADVWTSILVWLGVADEVQRAEEDDELFWEHWEWADSLADSKWYHPSLVDDS